MSSNISLRPATEQDCQKLTGLALRSKAHWGYSEAFMRQCEEELRVTPEKLLDAKASVVACTAQQQIVGFYLLEEQPDASWDLEALFVEPEFIGKGVGTRLMQDAKRHAMQSGVNKLTIQSDPNAVDFYLRHGATQIGSQPSGSIMGRTLPLLEVVF